MDGRINLVGVYIVLYFFHDSFDILKHEDMKHVKIL
jgi:hypothetical protein